MTSYDGRHAELYDLFYSGKPYRLEAEFVHQCLVRFHEASSARVLELACGTGTHALELARLGHRVTATDRSRDMLSAARAKAGGTSTVDFREADMRTLADPDSPYDAVVCLFDSIGYLVSNEAMAAAFSGIYRQLAPGGLLVVEFWHAAAMLRHHDRVRVRRWQVPNGQVIRISETELDVRRQLAHVTYSVIELLDDRSYSTFSETHTNRFFLVEEMRAMIQASGLEPLKWFAGFSDDERIDDQTWHVIGLARRPPETVFPR